MATNKRVVMSKKEKDIESELVFVIDDRDCLSPEESEKRWAALPPEKQKEIEELVDRAFANIKKKPEE